MPNDHPNSKPTTTNDPRNRDALRTAAWPKSDSTAVARPLFPTVVYATRDADALDAVYEGEASGFTYAREGHPNAEVLAQAICHLEGLEPGEGRGLITSSGMSAVSAVLFGHLHAGDHIIAGNQLYGRCLRMLAQDLPRLGIEVTLVDACVADEVAAAVRPNTKLILVETVANPTTRIADIDGIGKIAKAKGIVFAVDNTFTTPRSLQPLAHGADLVIHSVTKLLAGHADVTLGAVIARDEAQMVEVEDRVVTWGMTASPFDCWLAERGLATFPLRYDHAQATAGMLADALASHPRVKSVLYPGRSDHPDAAMATSLLGGAPANMLSFIMDGDRGTVNRFLQAAESLAFAPTLGDVSTTLSHPASSSHRKMTEVERLEIGIPEAFIRVSVGVEQADGLIATFMNALDAA